MAKVSFTKNLERHLSCPTVDAAGDSVSTVLHDVFAANPRLRSYLLDDQGRLRKHVNVFINNELIADRNRLTDQVRDDDEVFIFQALSGG